MIVGTASPRKPYRGKEGQYYNSRWLSLPSSLHEVRRVPLIRRGPYRLTFWKCAVWCWPCESYFTAVNWK